MKKSFLGITLLLLLLSGCSSSESPKKESTNVLPEFYSNLNTFLGGGSPKGACQFISEAQLEDSRSYARAAARGDLCRGTLQENFSFLIDPESFSLDEIEIIDGAEMQRKDGAEIWIQPVRLRMTLRGKQEEVLARSAAVVEDGKIRSLDGLRLSTVAPEQFARNIGSPTVITVDPVNAAYYSDPSSR